MAADFTIMGQCRCIALWLSKMQAEKSLTLHSLLGGSSNVVAGIFAYKVGQYSDYGSMPLHSPWIIQDARAKIVQALLTLIFRRW